MKILIVEDEATLASLLEEELVQWGYLSKKASNFNDILAEVTDFKPDLVLMDVSLPFYNGFYWTEKIRQISHVPIIFITSHTESGDIVIAMQMGADEYITKPIDITVTIAKIQAVLRRTYDYKVGSDSIMYGDLKLNLSVAHLEGKNFVLELTRTELLILEILFNFKNKIAKREAIINYCWQGDAFIDDNTLAVNIARLRKKLKTVGYDELIQTKKGIGYYLK